mmetsp:Transcript_53030/g.158061  ORF Transcript_53030/g.158061 Transcript_53030/m.158061 type:complete len:390 (-) Transcript_53030:938-2107(-)
MNSAKRFASTCICCKPNFAKVCSLAYSYRALNAMRRIPATAPFLLKGTGAKACSFLAIIRSSSSSIDVLFTLKFRRWLLPRGFRGSPRTRASWASKALTSLMTSSTTRLGSSGAFAASQSRFCRALRRKCASRWPLTSTKCVIAASAAACVARATACSGASSGPAAPTRAPATSSRAVAETLPMTLSSHRLPNHTRARPKKPTHLSLPILSWSCAGITLTATGSSGSTLGSCPQYAQLTLEKVSSRASTISCRPRASRWPVARSGPASPTSAWQLPTAVRQHAARDCSALAALSTSPSRLDALNSCSLLHSSCRLTKLAVKLEEVSEDSAFIAALTTALVKSASRPARSSGRRACRRRMDSLTSLMQETSTCAGGHLAATRPVMRSRSS